MDRFDTPQRILKQYMKKPRGPCGTAGRFLSQISITQRENFLYWMRFGMVIVTPGNRSATPRPELIQGLDNITVGSGTGRSPLRSRQIYFA